MMMTIDSKPTVNRRKVISPALLLLDDMNFLKITSYPKK